LNILNSRTKDKSLFTTTLFLSVLFSVVLFSVALFLFTINPAQAQKTAEDSALPANCSKTPPPIDRDKYIFEELQKKKDYWGYEGYGWFGKEKKKKGDLIFCHGRSPETENVFYIWPEWHYGSREDWFYPLQVTDTEDGVFVVTGREFSTPGWLDKKPVFDEPYIYGLRLWQTHQEETGKPQIVIVRLDADRKNSDIQFREEHSDSYGTFMIDMGVSPPFLAKTDLPWHHDVHREAPKIKNDSRFSSPSGGIYIKKEAEGVYLLSGYSYPPKSETENGDLWQYRYTRADKKFERIK
jgi:hypothetical protein